MILIGNGRLITWNPDAPYLDDGCVAVEGRTILAFGTTSAMKSAYPNAEFYDAKRRVIMPGLINTHTHIYSSFARGLSLPQAKPNKTFLDVLENQWWRIDKVLNEDDNRMSAYATGLESVRYGVTTLFDHHASQHHVRGSLSAIADSLKDIGMRASLCYEVSDRDGRAIAEEAIQENIAMIERAEGDDTDMLKGMFGLHASFTLSDDTLRACREAMAGKRAGYHVHVAEAAADEEDSVSKYGKRIVNRLNDFGMLGDRTLAIHNVHINDEEMDLLKSTGTAAVHNPESNMGNAVGAPQIGKMLSKGILLGLGTDAYTQDMFESLKVSNILQSHELRDPSVGFMKAMNTLFANNRQIAARYFDKPLGVIQAGAYADLIVVDYTPHTPLNEGTIAGHVMFGMMGRSVDCTMIAGRFIMKDRVMQTVDEEAILARSTSQAADFWRRVTT